MQSACIHTSGGSPRAMPWCGRQRQTAAFPRNAASEGPGAERSCRSNLEIAFLDSGCGNERIDASDASLRFHRESADLISDRVENRPLHLRHSLQQLPMQRLAAVKIRRDVRENFVYGHATRVGHQRLYADGFTQ